MKSEALTNQSLQTWGTPPWLFQRLHKEYNFDIDGAANENNALLPTFRSENNPLSHQDKDKCVFINPPWGRGHLDKDYWWGHGQGFASIMLVPFTPQTKMWFKHVWPTANIFVFNKRIDYRHPDTGEICRGIALASCLVNFNLKCVSMPDLGVWIKRKDEINLY
jgi:hypothetical protein